MNRNGPIIVIEDDKDDQEVFEMVYNKLPYTNRLVFLQDGDMALKYLNNLKELPFLIISDLNMPKMDGIELRKRIQNNHHINVKCVPYVILSTSVSKQFVNEVYSMCIQGYFQKPTEVSELKSILVNLMDYWQKSISPGRFIQA